MIIVENHRKKLETLRKAYPDALILDVTSHATGGIAQTQSVLSSYRYSGAVYTRYDCGVCRWYLARFEGL